MPADKVTVGDRRRRRDRGAAPAAQRDTYHHGDLRTALLAAAEAELADKGLEGFTLRGCARRAGVSHAAPAHHFKDVRALLTELAAIGFERLSASMEGHAAGIPPGSLDHILAIGRGYVAFAIADPHLFNLIFRAALLDRNNLRYRAAGDAAFAWPVRAIGAYRGADDPMSDPALAAEVIGIWSIVHGLAGLVLSGQFDRRPDQPPHAIPESPIARQRPYALVESLTPRLLDHFMAGAGRPEAGAPPKTRATRRRKKAAG